MGRFAVAAFAIVVPWLLFLAAIAMFAGCAGQGPEVSTAQPISITTAPVDLRPMCGTVKTYTDQQMTDLAAAIGALPDNSPIPPAFGDYRRMRDEARACAKASR